VQVIFSGKGANPIDHIISPLGGSIRQINVTVGDKVEIDDEVVILEAIKTEMIVFAQTAGKVVNIKVKKGEKVVENQVLMVIE
jgi:acetyl-CoA carboxylase biotin carboxyl carrier protein